MSPRGQNHATAVCDSGGLKRFHQVKPSGQRFKTPPISGHSIDRKKYLQPQGTQLKIKQADRMSLGAINRLYRGESIMQGYRTAPPKKLNARLQSNDAPAT